MKIGRLVNLKFRNFAAEFEPAEMAKFLEGFSHAEIERVCLNAIRRAVLAQHKSVSSRRFLESISLETRRRDSRYETAKLAALSHARASSSHPAARRGRYGPAQASWFRKTGTLRNATEQITRVSKAVDEALATHAALRSTIVDPALIVRVRTTHFVSEEEWTRAGLLVLGHDENDSVVFVLE